MRNWMTKTELITIELLHLLLNCIFYNLCIICQPYFCCSSLTSGVPVENLLFVTVDPAMWGYFYYTFAKNKKKCAYCRSTNSVQYLIRLAQTCVQIFMVLGGNSGLTFLGCYWNVSTVDWWNETNDSPISLNCVFSAKYFYHANRLN